MRAKEPQARARKTIDPVLFRAAMGSFASGVTVVGVEVEGEVHGMTANAFMSGSREPPLCVVSVAKRARTHALVAKAERFGVSILAADQEPLARHFSGRLVREAKFAFETVEGAPLLKESCARIATKLVGAHDCGDHTLYVGEILALEVADRPPLLYHRGAFRQFSPRASAGTPAPDFW